MPAKKKTTRKSATSNAAETPAAISETPVKKISEEQIKALTHRPKHTPALFKIPNKKQTPVVFTLDDVRDLLTKQQTPASGESAHKKPLTRKTRPAIDVTKIEKPTTAVTEEATQDKRKLGKASLDDILGISAKPAKPKYVIGKGPVDPKWEKIHKELISMRSAVLSELDMHSRDTLKRSAKDDSGDLSSFSSHMADNGTDTFDRDFALSMLSSEQEALSEIEAAIRRIYDGTYGICEITGEAIDMERLEAVPFTRCSLAGQLEQEKNVRRREKRIGAFLDSAEDNSSFGGLDDEE